MKSFKLFICLLVVSSLFIGINASQESSLRKKQAKANTDPAPEKPGALAKQIQDPTEEWFFGEWKEVSLQTFNSFGNKQDFTAKVKYSTLDKEGKIPFALELKDLAASGSQPDNGFVQVALGRENTVGTTQDIDKRPVLDFRLTSDCSFFVKQVCTQENAKQEDLDVTWAIAFNIGSDEEHIKNQQFGNKWEVRIWIPGMKEDNSQFLQKVALKLTNLCRARSLELLRLKEDAIKTGDVLYEILKDQKEKFNQQLEAEKDQNLKNKEKVKLEAHVATQNLEIQKKLDDNKKELDSVVDALNKLKNEKDLTDEQIKKEEENLRYAKARLQKVKDSLRNAKAKLDSSKRELSEAKNLRDMQLTKADRQKLEKTELDKKIQTEKAELARLLGENEAKMKQLQAEIAKVQTESTKFISTSEEYQKLLTKQAGDKSTEIALSADQIKKADELIEKLEQQIENEQLQLDGEQTTLAQAQGALTRVENILSQRLSVADKLKTKLEQQSAVQAQKDQDYKDAKKAAEEDINNLEQQRQAQLAQLKLSENQVKSLKEELKVIFGKYHRISDKFEKIVKDIDALSRQAGNKAKVAQIEVKKGEHAIYLNQILINMKNEPTAQALQRLAKKQDEINRLAKIYQKSAKKLRLQKMLKNKNKKAHKKAHKKADQ